MRPVVIIFGAAVRPDGSASGAMRGRVTAALETGRCLPDPLYMPTGGVGRHGPAEADVMTGLLRAAGIAPSAIRPERTARNTLRSALACARLIGDGRTPAFVATSSYHMVRCVLLLRLAGVRAQAGRVPDGPASRSWRKRWFWRLREFLAVPVDAATLLLLRAGAPNHVTTGRGKTDVKDDPDRIAGSRNDHAPIEAMQPSDAGSHRSGVDRVRGGRARTADADCDSG